MASIVYPGYSTENLGDSILGKFQNAFDRSRQRRFEDEAGPLLEQAFGSYLGGTQQPVTLSSIRDVMGGQPEQSDYATQRVRQAHGDTGGGMPDVNTMTAYIAKAAQQRGIDPGIAIKVARSEGLAPGVWQSNVVQNGKRERSYGPFQLYVDGGLGNQFMERTGLDPSDPANWQATVDFALDAAAQGGWSPWYGAAKVGVDQWDGIGRGQQAAPAMAQPQTASQFPQAPQVPGRAPQVQQAAMVQPQTSMPSRDVMRRLFANPETRPYAIQLAQAAMEARQNANDPVKQLQLQKLAAEVENLQNPEKDLINAGKGRIYDPNTGEWIVASGVAAPNEAPTVKKFYDEEGREYMAQWNPATRKWDQVGGAKAPSGGISVTSPDGTTIQVGGKLTEAQGKDVVYYTQGTDANQRLAELEGELTSFSQDKADLIPLGIGNYLRTPEFRQAKAAAERFLSAVLRKETGAAVTDTEWARYGPMFLPVPGDDPGTIQQKRRAREVALLAIRGGLGTADAVAAANRTIMGLPPEEGELTPFPEGDEEVPEDVDPDLWEVMTPEEKALWQN